MHTDYFIPLTLAKLENQRLMEQLKLERAQNEELEKKLNDAQKWAKAQRAEISKLKADIELLELASEIYKLEKKV